MPFLGNSHAVHGCLPRPTRPAQHRFGLVETAIGTARSDASRHPRRDTCGSSSLQWGVRAEHAFELVAAGPQVRSLPPKQPLKIAHEANGDACRSRIEETLAFDLRPHRMSPEGLTVILFNDTALIYRYE